MIHEQELLLIQQNPTKNNKINTIILHLSDKTYNNALPFERNPG